MKNYEKCIRVIEDFPKKGISFKDICPLLMDPKAFDESIEDMAKIVRKWDCDILAGPEARGFIFALPLAQKLGKGFVMARKKGKLPGKTLSKTYDIEYGTDTIEVPAFAIKPGTRVVLVDDLLATGGTIEALIELFEEVGAKVVGVITLIELTDLNGKEAISAPYESLIKYPH